MQRSPQNPPGQNTGVGSLSLLQGIFPTQGSDSGLSHCRWIFLPAELQGKPVNKEWTPLIIYNKQINVTLSLSALGSSHFMPHHSNIFTY